MSLHYEKTTLPNGLRVIKQPMPAVHSVAVAMYVKVGPRFESSEESGISHFVEHMIFKGTRNYENAQALSEAIDNIGADANGSTLPEFSEFTLMVHPRHLETGLAIFGDMIANSVFDWREIQNEKQIIIEELSQYMDTAGDSVSLDELSYNLLWPTTASNYSALGSDETITSFSREQLVSHYQKYYVPSNMVLSVAGNFDSDHLDSLVEDIFGGLSGSVAFPDIEYVQTVRFPRSHFKKMPTRMGYLKLSHKACSYTHPDLMPLLILADILGGGTASRLFATLREEEGLVYDVSAGTSLYSDVGSIDINTSTNQAKLIATLESMLDQIQLLRREGVSHEEVERVKDRVECQMDFLLDSPVDLAERLGVRELLIAPEKLEMPDEEMERLRRVRLEDTQNVIDRYLSPDRRGLVLVGASSWRQRRQINKLLQNG